MTPPKETSNGAALELVETAYLASTDEPDLSDQWEDWSLQYKCDVRSWLDTLTTKMRQVKAQLDQEIANELGENNAIRIADRIYRAQQGGVWKVLPDVARNGSLKKYLGEDWPKVVNMASPGAITKSRLEAFAKERKDAGAVDTFMTRESSGGPLTVQPVATAPKFLQKLEDGQTLYPPGKKELGS